ncbi:hypothetical protein C1645_880650 [Glomus cerebriforme]|uniref:Uncharacterized protein n=1 Tax=Glomus cerebriforme TaxID=658196 RepID=A0A397SA24_9GLOM|nr:hypothetical protein C1645_880650 [Glomus cerebriforme]
MVRKIPEIVVSLAPSLEGHEEQGQDSENLRNSSSQRSKNNKSHKKRKYREHTRHSRKNDLPKIIITSVSDDDEQEKSLTISNSNTKFPKIIVSSKNIENNEVTLTNNYFVDFDYTLDESTNKANQNQISNESSNYLNYIKQQKGDNEIYKNLSKVKEGNEIYNKILSKNKEENIFIKNIPQNKLPNQNPKTKKFLKFLKRTFLLDLNM